jgi:uncharacterized Ntn-hydrolase superfamily protein
MGVAVQSHWFCVGALVPWGGAGIGVVATQAIADPAYGPRGLELMESGMSASDALRALLSVDEGRDVRQVAFLDVQGRVAAHTGEKCIDYAGHVTGAGYSVQANMMLGESVVDAMSKRYEASGGDLAERLLNALVAAEQAGGDVRGRQSAAMLVVKGECTGNPWEDRLLDLRVEDHPEPLRELKRIHDLQRAYGEMNRGDTALEKEDVKEALVHYGRAVEIAPQNIEVSYWHAVTLAVNGRVEDAISIFSGVFSEDPNWMELTRRLHKPGVIPDTREGRALVERILKEANPTK